MSHISNIKTNYRFGFIVDHNDPEILASSRYLSWLYNTIFKIPIEFFTEKEFVNISYFDKIQNCIKYSALFLLILIKGKEPKNHRFWERLEDLNQKIPILTFYRGAKVLSKNKIGKNLYNLKYIGEKKGNLKDIKVTNKFLQKNIDIYGIDEEYLKKYNTDNLDNFVLVEQLKNTENTHEVLLKYKNEAFGIINGLNIFIGEKYIAIPREDYALEFNRPKYFINILSNLLSLLPFPQIRMRLKPWPICFRIDDFPSNWFLIQEKKSTITPPQLKQLIKLCRKEGIKLNAMITPAYISKKGVIKSWFQSDFKELINIMSDLKTYMIENIVEIGLHGYSHVTLGKRPKSLPNNILNRFLNRIFKQNYLASEFYDRMNRTEIPYSLQENAIKKAKILITNYFGITPKVFTPPQHNWDSNTEDILFNEKIPFLSCDMCFNRYPEGHKCRKNPSPIGTKAYNNENVFLISGTILAEPFPKTLELFNRLGIPFVLIRHNWEPECLTVRFLKKLITNLENFKDKQFLKMSELGDLLWDYEKSLFKTIYKINDDDITIFCELDLKTAIELHLDYRYEIIKVKSIDNEKNKILKNKISLDSGKYNFQIDLKKKFD